MDTLTRCGVIGDVHCEDETLERVLDVLSTMEVEPVLCVGDLVDGLGDADRTLELLRDRGVQCVAGNHERWFLNNKHRTLANITTSITDASRTFIEPLPKLKHYKTPHGNALLCHGVGEDDEAWLLPDTHGFGLQEIPTLRELMLDDSVQFMIGGHTHERMVRQFPGLTVINAGTIHRSFEQVFGVIDFVEMCIAFRSAAPHNTGELIEEREIPRPAPLS